jgi:hypothetical protein
MKGEFGVECFFGVERRGWESARLGRRKIGEKRNI